MRKTILLVLGLICGAWAATGTRVASVLACSGAEVRLGLTLLHPLESKEKLDEGMTVNVPGLGTVQLLFYKDGHREEVRGPCLVRISAEGCQVVHGGAGCLARIVADKRQLVLPQGEKMQSVGGNIAGISDPSMVKGAPVGAMVPPIRVRGDLELGYRQSSGVVTIERLDGPIQDLQLILKGPGGDHAVELRDDKVVLDKLVPGQSYCLWASYGTKLSQCLPFRILTSQEEAELTRLLADNDPHDAALIIDRLDQLGLPSLAAQRAEKLLSNLDDQDAGLLNYLYRLYSQVLLDNRRARKIKDKAEDLDYPLAPNPK